MRPEKTDPKSGRSVGALVALLLAALLTLAAGCRTETTRSFRVGYMICNSAEETQERFAPLTAYLSEKTGAEFEAVYLDTFDVEEAYARGDLDFTHTNSLLYITLQERHGSRLVAAEKRGTFGASTRGVIITGKDSGVQSLDDLRGKRLMFGPQWAPFGFLAQYAILLDAGINPEVDLGYYAIPKGSWKHEKIIYSVRYGAFDAGAAPLLDLEEMTAQGRIAPDDFVILAKSELAPYCTVAASPRVSEEWNRRVRDALLALDDRSEAEVGGERLLVLKRALVAGFEQVDDAAYEPVRRWARRAKMPPYEEY